MQRHPSPSGPRVRRGLRALVATALSLVLAATSFVASAEPPADNDPAPTGRSKHIARSTEVVPQAQVRPAASESATALALLNNYRTRVGAKAMFYDTTLDAALRAHANYLQLNINRPDLDPYTEVVGYPGYTAQGAAIAPWTSVTFQSPSYSAAIDLLMMDPWERSNQLLRPTSSGFAITRTTDFTVMAFNTASSTVSPQAVFPAGQRHGKMAFESSAAPLYTGNCPQTSNAWGYPITAQFDYTKYDSLTNVQSSLFRDGVPVSYCRLTTNLPEQLDAVVVMIPTAPLVQGSHYTGKVTATGVKDGTSTPVSLDIDFTTWAPVTRAPGDQTGDRIAEVVAVTSTGDLKIYKGAKPGVIRNGWVVGSGWAPYTWIAHTPDINGDGREDLLGRHSDGTLYLWMGSGMGSYGARRKVGSGWNGLSNLTVVGDMFGTGQINVVGVTATGDLMRYRVTPTWMGNTTKIGHGWNMMRYLTSVGSFNKDDKTADIIAVSNDGILYAYYTRNGVVVRRTQVGHGWNGWTAMFSPGDLSGDGLPDLLGRKSNGEMYSFTNLQGWWGTARRAGTGWNGMRLFA
ncbi:hypothetical protein [Aestuariimicrobium ganziense]|uniref:hypothetical protein n=1 Tax=Aestuariimicrobium ganziense TaxID=2773677 RepID=UPI0019434A7F|nr:hypothetical protein [Aestuariimicrobium ganziense]